MERVHVKATSVPLFSQLGAAPPVTSTDLSTGAPCVVMHRRLLLRVLLLRTWTGRPRKQTALLAWWRVHVVVHPAALVRVPASDGLQHVLLVQQAHC